MNNFMDREIKITEDGSHTFYVPGVDDHFHSVHGAVQESNHIFIENGLLRCAKQKVTVFEAGFGTGLNALLTLFNKGEREIDYFSIEKYPLTEDEYLLLNYNEFIRGSIREAFLYMHGCEWEQPTEIAPGFRLTKLRADMTDFDFSKLPRFDLIYYDAFAPAKQPELWNEDIFSRLAENTSPCGIIVTYCAQGEVRRKLTRAGFTMHRLPGPPGKKEILSGEKSACF